MPEYSTPNVAQLVFALILEQAILAGHHSDTVHAGRWSASQDFCYWDGSLIELDGLTLGLVGYGRIAQATARIARTFGMNVLATRRRKTLPTEAEGETDADTLRALARKYLELNEPERALAIARKIVDVTPAPSEGLSVEGLETAQRIRELFVEYGHVVKTRPDAEVEFVELDRIFRESDILSLHCPLTPETKEMANASRLGMMKHSAFLINTARGALVSEKDLADALNEGRIAGAGLDVLSTEPPPPTNPLLSAKNCVITPHIAWATRNARIRLLHVAAENIRAWLNGKPQNVVNP